MRPQGRVRDGELAKLTASIMRALKGRVKTAQSAQPPYVKLLDRRTMRELKWKFMNERAAADVLAFPEPKHFPHPETRQRVLGEIYLDRGEAKRYPSRLPLLVTHGVLHLLGYDHRTRRDRMEMSRLEEQVLKKIATH